MATRSVWSCVLPDLYTRVRKDQEHLSKLQAEESHRSSGMEEVSFFLLTVLFLNVWAKKEIYE